MIKKLKRSSDRYVDFKHVQINKDGFASKRRINNERVCEQCRECDELATVVVGYGYQGHCIFWCDYHHDQYLKEVDREGWLAFITKIITAISIGIICLYIFKSLVLGGLWYLDQKTAIKAKYMDTKTGIIFA